MYNAQGQVYDARSAYGITYCYWVGRKSHNGDLGGGILDPSHPFTKSAKDVSPESILMSDTVALTNPSWSTGGTPPINLAAPGTLDWGVAINLAHYKPMSNHITNSGIPDGGNILYNDGSVTWKSVAIMKPGYFWPGSSNGWYFR